MKKLNYIQAAGIDDASEQLKTQNAVLSAGGTDLIGALKDRILPEYPDAVVSIKSLKELEYIKEDGGNIRIGANTTLSQLSDSELINGKLPGLSQAAYSVATPNIRNTATIGGNICQDIRCWYYRYPNSIGERYDCARKGGSLCYAMMGENRYHSIFGAMKVCKTPCSSECPAGTDVPAYMERLRAGDWDGAARIIMRANPVPMLTSRVCPHPCQEKCNQNCFGDSVNIHSVERSLGDYIRENAGKYYTAPEAETGKRVAVIGAGPSGLSAAFYLRKAGHSVTVIDKMEKAGGVLRYGIPAYRLPKDIIDEVETFLTGMGIQFRFNTSVGEDVSVDAIRAAFDAVYIVTGAWKQPVVGLDGEELTQFGLDFLVEVNSYLKGKVGREVIVCGGGNVAMDVALVAKRLGVEKVKIVTRRAVGKMKASREEVDKVIEEGVEIVYERGLAGVARDESGKVIGLNTKGSKYITDENGKQKLVDDLNDIQLVSGDCIIMATGQKVDLDYLGEEFSSKIRTPRGLIEVDENNATRLEGVFAGGDAATGPDIAIRAIAAGRVAAKSISRYLGFPYENAEDAADPYLHFSCDGVHVSEANRLEELPVEARTLTGEDEKSFAPDKAFAEMSRCMNCGCLAVNSSDVANMLTAYKATVVTNMRSMSSDEFFCSKTRVKDVLKRGEIVTEIVVPVPAEGTVSAYSKYRHRKSIDFAVVAVASVYGVENGVIKDASIVLGACAPVPHRAVAAEEYLKGLALDQADPAKAADLALQGAQPLERNEYKIDMAKVMIRDSLKF